MAPSVGCINVITLPVLLHTKSLPPVKETTLYIIPMGTQIPCPVQVGSVEGALVPNQLLKYFDFLKLSLFFLCDVVWHAQTLMGTALLLSMQGGVRAISLWLVVFAGT